MFAFGPFRLIPAERRLEEAGNPVKLGGRGLDLLIALVERPGEVVGKQELLDRLWPDMSIDEGSLRFHVAVVRKILGEAKAGIRYIGNVSGRGYCFVAPVSRDGRRPSALPTGQMAPPRITRPQRLVGREQALKAVTAEVRGWRLVTVVGPGGIGKSSLAAQIGQDLMETHDGPVHLLDLLSHGDPARLADLIATTLGLPAGLDDPLGAVIRHLQDTRAVLVLDNCEPVIEAVAPVVATILQAAPQVHILATSREPLRVAGERVHRLPPLDRPPDRPDLRLEEALQFPAARVFADRVLAADHRFTFTQADGPAIAAICKRLDGIPLALGIAAGRAGTFGIAGLEAHLGSKAFLHWPGRRTAQPRHRTVAAMLDGSYALLTEQERAVMRGVSIFFGAFSLDGVQAVALDGNTGREEAASIMAGLVAKSLVLAGPAAGACYRLSDVTRTYMRAKLSEGADHAAVAHRHALWCCAALRRPSARRGADQAGMSPAAARGDLIGDTKAALVRGLSGLGEAETATGLAGLAAPLFRRLSLRSRLAALRALAALHPGCRGSREELRLQATVALSHLFARGDGAEAHAAFTRGLHLAEMLGNRHYEMKLAAGYALFHTGHPMPPPA